jgi:hypothetical protein
MNGTDWLVQRMNTLPSADNFHHQGLRTDGILGLDAPRYPTKMSCSGRGAKMELVVRA